MSFSRRPMKPRYLAFVFALTSVAWSQDIHNHTREVHGVPGGVPDFCSQPTVTSVAGGAWSAPATWSTGKVPAREDRVAIAAGHDVVYDVVSDAKLTCVEVRGRLRFRGREYADENSESDGHGRGLSGSGVRRRSGRA